MLTRLLALTLFACPTCLCAPTAWAKGAVTQQDIRELVKHQLARGAKVEKPVCIFKNRDVTVDLGRACLKYVDLGDQSGTLNAAMELQGTVEVIRRYRNQRFWKDRLPVAEQIIGQLLENSQKPGSSAEERWPKEQELRDQFYDYLYGELFAALRKKGYTPRQRIIEKAGDVYPVALRTHPPHANLAYMSAWDWTVYDYLVNVRKRTGVPRPQWIGLARAANGAFIIGMDHQTRFWFRAQWPNGTTKTTRWPVLVRVNSGTQTISF